MGLDRNTTATTLEIAGAISITIGAGMINTAAAWIIAGVLLAVFGLAIEADATDRH